MPRPDRSLALQIVVGLLSGIVVPSCAWAAQAGDLRLLPDRTVLIGREAHQRFLVIGRDGERDADFTAQVAFRCEDPTVASVDSQGKVTPVGDGSTTVVAQIGTIELRATIEVREALRSLPSTLERDVQPVLTRFGCNAGACHGKQRGQNGFQLSLFGFDPEFDLAAIAREGRGRRVFPAAPEQSLLLLKATATIPHGGGRKIEVGSRPYEILRSWIADGLPRTPRDAPALSRISIEPGDRILAPKSAAQLLVTAHYADGSTTDVTDLAAFQSHESAIAAVGESGRIQAGDIPGEAAIMARYRGQFANCLVSIPLSGTVPSELYENLPRKNLIDGLVWAKLKTLGIVPSGPAGDATFLRRAFLDVIGRLPSPDEARTFLADPSPTKREVLVDTLLNRPEYADYWASKWVDLLRPNPYRVGIKAVLNFDSWIRDSFRRNLPYDEFVRRVVTARGSTWQPGAATLFRDRREPEELTTMVSQLFLGIRLECAKCHHHPFEVYSQDDFYGFAAFFNRVGRKGTGLSPPISGGEEIVFTSSKVATVTNPATGAVMSPKPLFGSAPMSDGDDPREALAAWMTGPENPYFSRVIVNRVWADLIGRGLVEPVDDIRATNPASNGPLLDALAEDFRTHGHDLKHLIRTIMTSYVYSLESQPNPRNVADTRNASRHYRQRLRAEVLLDAISDITGVPETFDAAPGATRAMAIWTHRIDSLFLDTFGRPDENQDPPCERTPETSVVQALHLMNSPRLHTKVTDDNALAARLVSEGMSPEAIVENLYLRVYARFPTEDERAVGREVFSTADTPKARRETAEDLLWALLNTPEFVFKD